MKYQFNEGGRWMAGYKNTAGDCVVRAISIATEIPYKEVYNELMYLMNQTNKAGWKKSSPREGVPNAVSDYFLKQLGFKYMEIGKDAGVAFMDGVLPQGRLIVRLHRHLVAVIDGVLNDTYDSSKDGTNLILGYYYF